MDHHLRQISGWKFDDLDITIRRRLCEALHAAGRTNDAGESLSEIVNTVEEEVYSMRWPITPLVSGEICSTFSSSMYSKFHHRTLGTMSLHPQQNKHHGS